MTQFYTKNEEGEFVEASPDAVLADRKRRWEKTESGRIREEVTAAVREELNRDIDNEVSEKVKKEYQPRLDAANSKISELEIGMRRKTIAFEYGFKPELEKYLGSGSEDEMRAEADTLKNSFGSAASTSAEKTTQPMLSDVQEKTGVKVII